MQGDSPCPFYSMREVAEYFGVPLRTVALAYESLDLEGILHRIRGSQTMLTGRKPSTRQPVNAIVGLPIWLQAMITSPFECNLQIELEERLRARGYVADSIFYRSREDFDPDFTERLLRHNLDLIIWQSPHPLSSHVLMSLRERGMRLILLQPTENTLNLPSRTHLLDWQPAYHQLLKHWTELGIKRVVVPEPDNLVARRAIRKFKTQLAESGLTYVSVEASPEGLQSSKMEPNSEKSVLAFFDFQIADNLCNGYSDLIEQIASEHRLAFCRGPVRVPRLTTLKTEIDLVQLNPIELAEKVVEDLCDPHQTQEGTRSTITATFHVMQSMPGLNDFDRFQLNM